MDEQTKPEIVVSLTDADFAEKTGVSDKPVLVDFWAPWCGPCKMLSPLIDEIAGEMKDKAHFYKLNVDENPQTAQHYNVMSIPTVVIMVGGEIKETFVGVQGKDTYINALNTHIS